MNFRLLCYPLLVLLVALSAAGCDGCSSSLEAPADDAEARIAAHAQLIPADADAALVVPEIRQMPETMHNVLQRHRHVDPGAQNLATRISQDLGVQITSLEMMELAGFHLDGSLMVSMVDGRPVLTIDVADKSAFERYFTGHIRRERRTETRIEDVEFGEREFRVSGDSTLDDLAWTFDGSSAIVVLPPYEFFEDYTSNSAPDVAERLGKMSPDETLADSDAFQSFRERIGDDYPVGLYLSWAQLLDDDSAGDIVGMGFRGQPQSIDIDAFDTGVTDADWSRLLSHDLVQRLISGLDFGSEQMDALTESLTIDSDDTSLTIDVSGAHDGVTDREALEDYVSLVRSLDTINIDAEDGEETIFRITFEFTEPIAAQ